MTLSSETSSSVVARAKNSLRFPAGRRGGFRVFASVRQAHASSALVRPWRGRPRGVRFRSAFQDSSGDRPTTERLGSTLRQRKFRQDRWARLASDRYHRTFPISKLILLWLA